MQRYDLTLKAEKRPETLERILRVVRHRGFEVLTLNARNNGNQFEIALSVQSERAIELLTHQLSKLIDVTIIE
ncbi:acetolactate synthase 2 small subunit [Actinobacillus pleuropneumoniae]|uniref:Acetolactate synthase isozyme II small subunit n=3 Tax=Actinobacillus TaxID=713 RepID=B0BS04_ACTPJ|nr:MULTISPECIES: acetolactate synthase 2 small subunit [Actinobacillus]ABY68704.1 acetolactate synthase isozyme II small subunit [Actinobacillus pleuropneumoniae serovar 3 str. JL03]ACE60749.1 Acetolactate synthase isozyme II small subunit (AHAS-II) [Actinobacillus pleuropneumoniae serovar 7 str. AP76]EFM90759.1 Acetolactate synthase isozyme II small subunit [Actinobacillus pleuropneumoniae serovar 4 str. M62]EFM95156.1 Acetolactate synthase isozyme II small subunit [Actinobacillus pleuropneumo